MTVGRDPADRLIDLAVNLPITVALVAREAVPLVLGVGKRSTTRQLHRWSTSARQIISQMPDDLTRVSTPGGGQPEENPQDRLDDGGGADDQPAFVHEDEAAPADLSEEDLPIEGYNHLAARQVVDRLEALEPAELGLIERYEREHRHRRTILGKIDQLRGSS